MIRRCLSRNSQGIQCQEPVGHFGFHCAHVTWKSEKKAAAAGCGERKMTEQQPYYLPLSKQQIEERIYSSDIRNDCHSMAVYVVNPTNSVY
jgi:hypothetical protein